MILHHARFAVLGVIGPRIFGLSALVLALAACGGDSSESAPPADTPAPAASVEAVTLDGEGLRTPAGLIAFGAPAGDGVAAVTAALGGAPATRANSDCPTGETEDYNWGDTLALITRDGAFIGWRSSQAGPTTSTGVHAGSNRTDAFEILPSGFEQIQIAVDGVYGFLNADGQTVDVLYAGETCIAS